MGSRKTIDQWSLRYWITKYVWAKRVFNLYYEKIEIKNVSIIPRNTPVILAPNHQNALMDAMALVTQIPFQTVFMARADIFKGRLLIKVLTFLKILPIYRIRDGISSLSQNEEIFDETTEILRRHHNPLCLFPEGNHGEKRRLRPLVKGIFRIAFKAQADYKDKAGIKIIPVGIDYKHYQKFRQTLFINFGKPIEVSDYWNQYIENPAVAINALRDKLIEEMRKCMIDIQTNEYYDTYMGLREFYRPEMYKMLEVKSDKLSDRFYADKKLIASLDKTLESNSEIIKDIDIKFKEYARLCDKLNLRDWVLRKNKYPIVLNILGLLGVFIVSPLFLLGLFNNWPHYFIPIKFSKTIKDPQFRSTASWGMGIAIQAVYYLILSILAFVFIPIWWLALVYIACLPLTGLISYAIRSWCIKSLARIKYTLNVKKSKDFQQLLSLKNELTGLLKNMAG